MSSPPSQTLDSLPATQHIPKKDGDMWTVNCIMDERGPNAAARRKKSRGDYLVDWAGVDPTTHEPYEMTWVEKSDVTDDLIVEWKRKVKANPGIVGEWGAKVEEAERRERARKKKAGQEEVVEEGKKKKKGKGKRKRSESTMEDVKPGPSAKKARASVSNRRGSSKLDTPAASTSRRNRTASTPILPPSTPTSATTPSTRSAPKRAQPIASSSRRRTRQSTSAIPDGAEEGEVVVPVPQSRSTRGRAVVPDETLDAEEPPAEARPSRGRSRRQKQPTPSPGPDSLPAEEVPPAPVAGVQGRGGRKAVEEGKGKEKGKGKGDGEIVPGTPSEATGTQSSTEGARGLRRGRKGLVVESQEEVEEEGQGEGKMDLGIEMQEQAEEGEGGGEEGEMEVDEQEVEEEDGTVEEAEAEDDAAQLNEPQPEAEPTNPETAEEARAAEEEFNEMQAPMNPLAPPEAASYDQMAEEFEQETMEEGRGEAVEGEGGGEEDADGEEEEEGGSGPMEVDVQEDEEEEDLSESQAQALDAAVRIVLKDLEMPMIPESVGSGSGHSSGQVGREERQSQMEQDVEMLEPPEGVEMVEEERDSVFAQNGEEVVPENQPEIEAQPEIEPQPARQTFQEQTIIPDSQAIEPIPAAGPPAKQLGPVPALPAAAFFPHLAGASTTIIPATQESEIDQFSSPVRGRSPVVIDLEAETSGEQEAEGRSQPVVATQVDFVEESVEEVLASRGGEREAAEDVVAAVEVAEQVAAVPEVPDHAVIVAELSAEIELLKASLAAKEQKISSLETRHTSDQKDLAFTRKMYSDASNSAVAHADIANTLRQENQTLKGQVRLGLKQKEEFYHAALKAKDVEILELKRLNDLHVEKDRRTNDDVRKRASECPRLIKRIKQQRDEIDNLEFQKARLQDDNDALRGIGDSDEESTNDGLGMGEFMNGGMESGNGIPRTLSQLGYDNHPSSSSPAVSTYHEAEEYANSLASERGVAGPSVPSMLRQSQIPEESFSQSTAPQDMGSGSNPSDPSVTKEYILCKWWIEGIRCGFVSESEEVMTNHVTHHVMPEPVDQGGPSSIS